MDNDNHRIERFDPILRNLLAWQLVARPGTDAEGGWQLVPSAQQRLSELVRSSTPPDKRTVVYLDHLCADCHQRRPTRAVGGAFLCDPCRQLRSSPPAPVGEADGKPRRRRPLSRAR
jgi:hypothetical protein